jgi:Na+-translocating ferredoxin:NAD+ oxidoreductase subunit A
MKQLILILISAAIVNNVVLSQFLGLCPFLGVSKKVNTAAGMGGSVIFVVTLSSLVTGLIHDFILKPLGLDYLNTIVFILVIAALVQFIEMFLKKYVKNLYKSLGIYLPLITTNCCVLGTALNIVDYKYNVGTGTLYGFGVSAGFAIAIIMMAGVREKIEDNDIPHAFQGTGIVVLTAGLMAIAFFGFSGII